MSPLRIPLGAVLLLGLALTATAASNYQITLGTADYGGYVIQSLSNPRLSYASRATPNPALNLILGKRYAIINPAHRVHPIQIIAAGAKPAEDRVLLSQNSATGAFNRDAGVKWSDNGAGTVEFTLTRELWVAMRAPGRKPGYRCAPHAATMRGALVIYGTGVVLANPIAGRIPRGTVTVELTTVTSGLTAPLGAEFATDGTRRMFIYDQIGLVWIVKNGARLPRPFLDVRRLITPVPGKTYEQGLLGFALHPKFASTRKFYTHTSEPTSGTADFNVRLPAGVRYDHYQVITEWTVSATNPDAANPASRRVLMRIAMPQGIHNGGMIRFGPDGYLYIGTGDGGGSDDSNDGVNMGHDGAGNGQNLNVILGKILRINVDGRNSANKRYGIPADNPFVGRSGLDEIFFFGLRNPYSFSFDRVGGALWIGDVGQNSVEEITRVTAAQKGGNLGWRVKEGRFFFDPQGASPGAVVSVAPSPPPPRLIDPVAQYDHDDGPAVIGGFVYRGMTIPGLAGKYVFGDFGNFFSPSGRLFYLDGGNIIRELRLGATNRKLGVWIKGLAQDSAGDVYVCGTKEPGPWGTSGMVLKIVAWPAAAR